MKVLALPRWLADEPAIQSLLHAVLDRFDQQSGKARQKRLYFLAEKYLTALKRLNDEADQLWLLIQELQRLELLNIRVAVREPFDPEWKGAKLGFMPDSEETLRVWLDRPSGESALQHWRSTVEEYVEMFPAGIEALLKRRITMPGWNDEKVVRALTKLGTISEPYTVRQLSALLFAGDSKRLDGREELVQDLFPDLPLKPRALLITVKLPEDFRGVLFIENQDTYALALSGLLPETEDLALVYTAGFRGGAVRIRDRLAVLLHYHESSNKRALFESWWFNPSASPPGPVSFFGDLDFSGMGILATLRQRFGEVGAWQAGYQLLLDKILKQGGHCAAAGDKVLQIDPGTTGCSYADQVLLPAIREHGFIDQEVFDVKGGNNIKSIE